MTFSEADTSSESARTFEDSENEDIISSIESATSISPISDVSVPLILGSPADSSESNTTYWGELETDCDIAEMEKCLDEAKACISRIKTRRGLYTASRIVE
jgi:hypothetical protein